jgi:hypothetical protein
MSGCTRYGYVYFVEAVGTGTVKIGWCNYERLDRRIASLQTGCPHELKLLTYYSDSQAGEKHMHRWFFRYHVHGEWFRHEGELAKYIAELKALENGERILLSRDGIRREKAPPGEGITA